ncbi:MAG: 1,4-alpha-glucan branching protein GlgB [Halofilum sp. (in: g-proteobacteria)]|nr:1,4-alpha-glucan branching protein GlgB [Halofilum sp. (in: g-proteobacteria)]
MADDHAAIAEARHARPHDLLGRHPDAGGERIVTFHPEATAARFAPDGPALKPAGTAGVFEWRGPSGMIRQPWAIEWRLNDGTLRTETDPWAFVPETDAAERRAFHEGRHTSAWHLLGAHGRMRDGTSGVRFTAWAPGAQRVSVIGSFNDWRGNHHPLTRHDGGIWETFIPNAGPGDLYKFEILDAGGQLRTKTDPFARFTESRPQTASIVLPETVYPWGDSDWPRHRPDWQRDAVSFYEVHLGSWLRHWDGKFYGYHELGERLARHVTELGFTHVELLPITEHPLDASWGYQCTGWFAPTRRFGTPDDFRALVDTLHRHGIGVVLDWVPGHFPRDEHGLARFDGTALYEPADPRRAEMRDWGTLAFDHGRPEVRSFLVSSAMYWLREFHIDGLRVDAVASMIYLDFGREDGEWLPNVHGGHENLEAVAFLQQLNATTHGECPASFTVAEESTAWPGVTQPVDAGGLGFSMKWNMGWMHDSLTYLKRDPVHRRHHHDDLTFGITYAFSENYVLPLSHDEVVHMKGSLLTRMPGDEWQRFANLRLLFAWHFTYPGKKLLFMGGEIGNPREWDHDSEPDWRLVDHPHHLGVRRLVADLNACYRHHPALHALDFEAGGFAWIDCHDEARSVLSYRRRDGNGNESVIVLNFTPEPHHGYRIGLPHGGRWREVVNTDSRHYGGSGQGNLGGVVAEREPRGDLEHSAPLTLPPLAGVVLVPEKGHDG